MLIIITTKLILNKEEKRKKNMFFLLPWCWTTYLLNASESSNVGIDLYSFDGDWKITFHCSSLYVPSLINLRFSVEFEWVHQWNKQRNLNFIEKEFLFKFHCVPIIFIQRVRITHISKYPIWFTLFWRKTDLHRKITLYKSTITTATTRSIFILWHENFDL